MLDDVCDGLDEHHTHRNVHTQSLEHADFRPVIRELLRTHPGLEFLKDSPEFQDRYLETVTYRIFFEVNTCWNGKLRASEFRKSDLLQAMRKCDETDDVNKCLRYFSYEHFYVMYCKFWELDTDHDFLIDKEDLLRYGNHALTYRAVDRVFSQAPRQFTSGVPQKMGYEDFCWFVLSEEDKQNPLAQMYWLRVVDLDGDGVIRPREMLHFYEEQVQRMECLNQEPVLWEDVLCQMMDMLKPAVDGEVTINDLKKCKLAGNFFNVLFNLNKFIAFETRDPFSIRQEREGTYWAFPKSRHTVCRLSARNYVIHAVRKTDTLFYSSQSRTSPSGIGSRAASTSVCQWRRRRTGMTVRGGTRR